MIIDGKKIANQIAIDLKEKILNIKGRKPTLMVILVGNNPSSLTYIKMKRKACENIGFEFILEHLDETITEEILLKTIEKANLNKNIDALLVQMPLPEHINDKKIFEKISPYKDVDGFNPENIGKVLLGEDDTFFSCTPLGIKVLLEKMNIDIQGKHVVIVGRSNIVGKPLAAMLMQKKKGCDATVTVANSRTQNLKEITKSADIIIAAIGKPKFITKDMVSKKAVIIDVGINHIIENGKKTIVGDTDFRNLYNYVKYITPVPKGVGPMTIAMLLNNVYKAYLINEKR
ncbi:MAG: bifunctional 5,10-methylene-tetrahydrofolate dehydrogenase/5,10-methylene-tetrahydrofolate cyclohydrolase [Chlamydiae bacterium RIFCSPHIGHO2_12_FULL_27_8]|nr:MAG: bifunctional 5,10-methylene-tetrahydrofolate dehydrogenase/5,10-methylene-tetrahydrofolate cyclohydrolase [Chlamydiae bacterium RIFCSPHIGHO2_12_FULL_27_8]